MCTVNIHDLLEEDLGPLVNYSQDVGTGTDDEIITRFYLLSDKIDELYKKYAELIKDETDGE